MAATAALYPASGGPSFAASEKCAYASLQSGELAFESASPLAKARNRASFSPATSDPKKPGPESALAGAPENVDNTSGGGSAVGERR